MHLADGAAADGDGGRDVERVGAHEHHVGAFDRHIGAGAGGDADARHCIIEGHGDGDPAELTDELMAAVARLMRRG